MRILGISGLPNAVGFKRSHWPGLDEREYRISQGHDSAAALVANGEILAAVAEERFNLIKHSGDFPSHAIGYCLSAGEISIEDVDEIVHSFDYSPHSRLYSLDPVSGELYRSVFSREALLESVRQHLPGFPAERVHHVPHHLAHAASAYFTSGWDECLVVVIDAMGETESSTIYSGNRGSLEKLRWISANDSIGILYSLVTLHLGFDFNADEYKIMGLAPYGDPARFRPFFEQAVELRADGTVRIPILRMNHTREERENFLRYPPLPFGKTDRASVARRKAILDVHRDLAAALQECLDRVVLHICGHFASTTGLRRLALAGGVALNCSANGKLFGRGRSTKSTSSLPPETMDRRSAPRSTGPHGRRSPQPPDAGAIPGPAFAGHARRSP